jgi:transporter family protein
VGSGLPTRFLSDSGGRRMMRPWLSWTLLTLVVWGFWAILSKVIGNVLTGAQSQTLSTIGLAPILIALACSKRLTSHGNQRRGIALAFAAGIVSSLGNIAYYDALNRGAKVVTVVPLTALYPLTTVLLAMIWLRERLNAIQCVGLVLSVVAIYLFNVPGEHGLLSPEITFAFAPIVLWGLAGFLQKLSTNHISGERSALWCLAAFVPVAGFLLLWDPIHGPIPDRVWALSVALGFFLGLGNLTILAAFASGGKASIIAPLAALYPLISVPAAIFLFREPIGSRETAGIVFALASVVALSWERSSPHPATI